MPIVAVVAGAIAAAVAAAAAAVVNVVASIVIGLTLALLGETASFAVASVLVSVTAITPAIITAIPIIVAVASTAYSIYSIIAAFTQGNVSAGVAGVVGAIGGIYTIAGGTLKGYVNTVVDGFKDFTKAIDLELALKINDIIALTSDSYRQTMGKLYQQIGSVSQSLGHSAAFMQLLIRDAKYVIQDVSALMGRRYDLGEVVWLKTLDDYLKKFSQKADKYIDNPGELIFDIDQWLFKPAIDAKGTIYQNLYALIETTLTTSKQVIDEIVTVRGSMDSLIKKLPIDIQQQIDPYMKQVFNKYDYWIDTIFRPTITTLDLTVERYKNNFLRMEKEITELVKYLINPADYLATLNKLSPGERERGESIIADIVTRPYQRDVYDWVKTVKPMNEFLDMIRAMIKGELYFTPWDAASLRIPSRFGITPGEVRTSWFVGDY